MDKGPEYWFFLAEMVVLGLFCIDISLHIIAFGTLYLIDAWNVLDLIIILLSIAFVWLDIFSTNETVSSILKIRGIFRLLRIFILYRKLNAIRLKRDKHKKMRLSQVSHLDVRTPSEIITEMLVNLRDRINVDDASIGDLNYCLKMIASNRLYEADVDLGESSIEDESSSGNDKNNSKQNKLKTSNKDVITWHRQFAAKEQKTFVKNSA
mmetsp:Transcript_33558/g.24202  ORF Transcript_33558/g.24202 Transcript_33558/m.24202 type:complete len:209 (-) Transcript_33558:1275-1901(-)